MSTTPQRAAAVNPQAQAKGGAAPTQQEQNDFQRLLEMPAGSERNVSFTPFGSTTTIKLSVKMVQEYIAVPTKSGKTCSEREATRFIMMCLSRKLDPFTGDAFCIGYDSKDGPTFSLITAHQAYLKRAEVHSEYDGMQSGVIIRDVDDQLLEREGDYVDEGETLLGGWAKVYHKNRKFPTYRRIRLQAFYKGFGRWQDDAAGMICKVAEADALRSTFPTMLGGLYSEGEVSLADYVTGERNGESTQSKNLVAFTPKSKRVTEPDEPRNGGEEGSQDPEPAQPSASERSMTAALEKQGKTPQQALADLVFNNGYTWEHFMIAMKEGGSLTDPTQYASFDDIPTADCVRLVRGAALLARGLQLAKGGGA